MKRSEIVKTFDLVAADPGLSPETRAKVEVAAERARAAAVPDTWVYRLVVGVLGAVALMTVGGGIALAFVPSGADLPQAVVSIGSAAVGALAGLLAPTPQGDA